MKKLLTLALLFVALASFGQTGYEIKVTLKPFTNQYIFLAHYSGKQFPIVDSAKLNASSQAVFKGTKKLGGGIYLIVYPAKNNYFEVLVDKQQRFSVIADTATIRTRKTFVNSPDNDLFTDYQDYMGARGRELDGYRKSLAAAKNHTDSAHWNQEIRQVDSLITGYRKGMIEKHPNSILTTLLHLMQEPVIPPAEKHPGGKYDSVFAYNYYKSHYWDHINFWDDRITRTPASLFDERLDKYFNTLVVPNPDSVKKELDWMLGYAAISDEMTRYLLVKFVNRYLQPKYMWDDEVFVFLFDKYFNQKNYSWLNAQGKKTITDRYYSVVQNLLGSPAENIALPDSSGKMKSLYDESGKFTIVCFWDPTCSHCQETLPVIDSIYQAKWKALDVRIYAVAKETSGTRADWTSFMKKHGLHGWTHVYYSKADEKARVDANIPGYSQLYDVQTLPTVYLLDKDKKIIAKKLTWQQADDIMQLKLKNAQ